MADDKKQENTQSKGKPDKKAKKPKEEKVSQKDEKADFQYIVRLINTDIDGKKHLSVALTSIPGVGYRMAPIIAARAGLTPTEKIGNFSEAEIKIIEENIEAVNEYCPEWMFNRQKDIETGESSQLLGSEISMRQRDDINLMRMIRCYKGVRHERGHKVRGQRTRANGRKGLTLGVSKKSVQGGGAKKDSGDKKK